MAQHLPDILRRHWILVKRAKFMDSDEHQPPCIFESCVFVIVLFGCCTTGGCGLCDCPVAL